MFLGVVLDAFAQGVSTIEGIIAVYVLQGWQVVSVANAGDFQYRITFRRVV
jgi:hypothetical protein